MRDCRATPAYKAKRKPNTRAEARRAFLEGMCARLLHTLMALHAKLKQPGHDSQIAEARAHRDQSTALTPGRRIKRASGSRRLDGFRAQGDQAGRGVDINLGLSEASGPVAPLGYSGEG